jgi:DNA-binding NarL/FixJ family response regulator
MNRARVLLADDHSLMLDGIRNLLRANYTVVGAVEDGNALVAAAVRLKPDLILLDITMPLLNGIDAARQIRKHLPEVKLLFVTMHTRPSYLQAALEAGANGYAVKSSGRKELLAAVDQVVHGGLYIAPGVGGNDVGRLASASRAAASLRPTARERQILQLVAEGKSRKEVAHALGISEKTVAFHRTNVKRKLGLSTTAQVTRYALEEGLV